MNKKLENTIKRLEEEVNKQAEIIQWYEKENRHNQEIIDKLNFIKNRKNQGASQENVNKMAIEFVNSWLKEVK